MKVKPVLIGNESVSYFVCDNKNWTKKRKK